MGEKQTKPFQLSFNGLLKVDFQGSHVTSDGGLILVRELDERLGLGELIDEHLSDSRQGTNKQFTLADLLRQSVYSRLAGYEDLNDAERVSIDPTFRLIGSQKIWDRGAALTSTLHGFETEMLASEENLLGLMALNRELVGQAEAFDDSERVVLDMDSTESPVHGQQEGSAYNGHFESVCYHPLLLFNGHGDCLAAKLRPGNAHSAEDWDELLLPEIERQQAAGKQVALRGDAAFAKPEVYEASEERGVQYAIRIPANKSLELEIEDILFRPPGRPSRKPLVRYKSFRYQAESWSQARRIVAKVEHHQGELFPRVGFIVTSMSLPSRSVVRFYNKRGTAEQWIKEGKQATHWTRLSCHRFRANEVRLQLSVPAYNLGNLWRRLGRSLGQVIQIVDTLVHRNIRFIAIKEGIEFDGQQDLQTKVMIALFGLFTEVERDLISERTKEGLAAAKAQGKLLGRPKGALGKSRLDGKEQDIRVLLGKNVSKASIAKILDVSRSALYHFIETRKIVPS